MGWIDACRRLAGLVLAGAVTTALSTALVQAGSTRAARAGDCKAFDRGYGVTISVALVEHDVCEDNGRGSPFPPAEVAPAGWWRGGLAFSGRFIPKTKALVVYQVSPDGALLWYRSDAPGGELTGGFRVGAKLGDWRRFHSLYSPGNGRIFGVDGAGRVLGWRHLGYADGADQWEGPELVGHGFGPGWHLVGIGTTAESFLVGIGVDHPDELYYWQPDGHRTGDPQPIVGVPVAGPLTWCGQAAGYGRDRAGRIVRITRTGDERGVQWTASTLGTDHYVRVFAGGRWALRDPHPYEWQ